MSAVATLSTPFNAAQLQIIQLFAEGVNDDELTTLRQILIDFKFNRVTALADKIIDANAWSADDLAHKAQKMKRTPYKAKIQSTVH